MYLLIIIFKKSEFMAAQRIMPLRLRLGLRLVPRYRYCLEFRALRLGSLLGLGLPVTAKARSRAIYIIAVLPIIEYRI